MVYLYAVYLDAVYLDAGIAWPEVVELASVSDGSSRIGAQSTARRKRTPSCTDGSLLRASGIL